MLKYLLIALLAVFAVSQLPCANKTLQPIYAYARTNAANISLTVGYNVVSGRWNNPVANQSYVVDVWGWNSLNGSLVQAYFNPNNATQIVPSVAYNQSGVLFAPFNGNNTFVFAQKDTSNSMFQIKLTAQQSSNTSFGFAIYLYQGYYNNIYNNTCDLGCNGTVKFASINGTVYPTQFVCQYGAQQSFLDSLVNGFLSIF